MLYVGEVERFGHPSSEVAGIDRLASFIRTGLAIYMMPVLAVVVVIGVLAVFLQCLIYVSIKLIYAFRLSHQKDEFLRDSGRIKISGLVPGQCISVGGGIRCGRYVPIFGQLGEPSWSPSHSVSLH